jgi:hypothetical protein
VTRTPARDFAIFSQGFNAVADSAVIVDTFFTPEETETRFVAKLMI